MAMGTSVAAGAWAVPVTILSPMAPCGLAGLLECRALKIRRPSLLASLIVERLQARADLSSYVFVLHQAVRLLEILDCVLAVVLCVQAVGQTQVGVGKVGIDKVVQIGEFYRAEEESFGLRQPVLAKRYFPQSLSYEQSEIVILGHEVRRALEFQGSLCPLLALH